MFAFPATFVAPTGIAFKGSSGISYLHGSGSVSSTLPAHAAGDLLVFIFGQDESGTFVSGTITGPGGWTSLYQAADTDTELGIVYKTAASSSETNPAASTSGGSTENWCVAYVFSGAATPVWNTAQTGSSILPSMVYTDPADGWTLIATAFADNAGTVGINSTSPGSVTVEKHDLFTGSPTGGAFSVGRLEGSSAGTITYNQNLDDSAQYRISRIYIGPA